jgi:hypothetical protein
MLLTISLRIAYLLFASLTIHPKHRLPVPCALGRDLSQITAAYSP